MIEDLKNISKKIKSEADLLIKEKLLYLSEFGNIVFTGSYKLDLMTWRDIDLQLQLSNKYNNSKDYISHIINHMILDDDLLHIEYSNCLKDKYPKMPDGLYFQFKFTFQNEIWKIDLWVLKEQDFIENKKFIEEIESKLSQDYTLKDLILELKFDIMKDLNRPPTMSSYFLYKAVLFENIRDREQIKKFIESMIQA